jgi:hypothetical protein
MPLEVWVDIATESVVVMGVIDKLGKETELASVTVAPLGAPDCERVRVLGSPVVVDPETSETLTV